MNVLRSWTLCSSPCRASTSFTARRISPKLFGVATRTESLNYFSTTALRRSSDASAPQSILSQASNLIFRQSPLVQSRLGWIKESATKNLGSVKRSSGLSSSSRRLKPSPSDPEPQGILSRLRQWFNLFPSQILVWGIIGLNGAVFFAWQYAYDLGKNGDPSLYIKMQNNIQNSWRNIREGRVWSIVASTFSHSLLGHVFLNCLSFYFLAPPIVNLLGNSSFMGLYFLGGISCSMLSLLLNRSVSEREGSSHGASGAIFAVMSFFACVSPNTKFLIFGIIPAPAWAVVTGFFVWDGLSTISDRRTVIDGAGHVGGILAGVAYYIMKRRMLF